MTEILMYWGGDERGSDFAVPRGDFPWCVPIATQTLHAAGAAMAFKVRKEPRCALAYIGDGGTLRGSLLRSAQSGRIALPARGVRHRQQRLGHFRTVAAQTAAQTLAQKAVAAGIPGVQGRRQRCVCRPRNGCRRARGGAARRRPESDRSADLPPERSHHADDASRYRSAQEVKDAWEIEPLVRLRQFLVDAGLWDSAREQTLLEDCARQVDAAVAEYLAAARQPTDAMFDHLFASLPARLHEQRAVARRYASKSSGH